MRDIGWHRHQCLTPKTLITGERTGWLANLRRRRVKGGWVYRWPTDEEAAVDLLWEVW